MAIIQDPNTSTRQAFVDVPRAGARVSSYPNSGIGHYSFTAFSGLITGVAAGSATAGHLFSLRWGSVTHTAIIKRIRVGWYTTTGFTGAQEMALAIYQLTGYSAAHTGGTAITTTDPELKRRAEFANSAVGVVRIATTGALTAGTHTLFANPLAWGGYAELAAGAAVQKGFFFLGKEWAADEEPYALTTDTGFIVRNEIAMGAAGVGRMTVSLDWRETLNADYAAT